MEEQEPTMVEQEPKIELYAEELFKTNFSLFNDLEESIKIQQIKTVNYIANIANQLEKNIEGINLLSFIPNENNIFTTNENEINKVLMEFDRTKFIEETKTEISLLTEEQFKEISGMGTQRIKNDLRNARSNATRMRTRISNTNRDMYDMFRDLRQIENLVKDLEEKVEKGDDHVANEINKLLESGNYINPDTRSDRIYLELKDNIICTFKKPSAGIDLRVDLGRFRITFINESVYYTAIKDNIMVEIYSHPHLSGYNEAEVCFGNMLELFRDNMREGKIAEAIEVTRQVLLNYCDDNPFMPLAAFALESEQVQPNGSIVEREEEWREESIHCHNCDNEIYVEFNINDRNSTSSYVECIECGDEVEYDFG